MKSKRFIFVSLLLLGSMSLTGCDWPWNNNQQNQQEKQKTPSSDVKPTSDISGYYGTIKNQDGDDLLNALHSIVDTTDVSTSYDWYRFKSADEDPKNENNIVTIYARTSLSKSDTISGSKTKGWNREHTFPQSKLKTDQALHDNHIVFASDYEINSKRSSYKMGVLTTGATLKDSYGNNTTCRVGKVFDPNNVARGIVARSTMYAAAMYGLNPLDNFESWATLITWHLNYPVTQQDMNRNEVVYTNQHNRNPFVDHPEYACKIWGGSNSTTINACKAAGYSY